MVTIAASSSPDFVKRVCFPRVTRMGNKLTILFSYNALHVSSFWISKKNSLLCMKTWNLCLASEKSGPLLAGCNSGCRPCHAHSSSCPPPVPGAICLLPWERTALMNSSLFPGRLAQGSCRRGYQNGNVGDDRWSIFKICSYLFLPIKKRAIKHSSLLPW